MLTVGGRCRSDRARPAISRKHLAQGQRCSMFTQSLARDGELVSTGHGFPIDEIGRERIDVLRSEIAIVDIVGVLPHVAGQQRSVALGQQRVGIPGLGHGKLIAIEHRPGPAAAELCDTGRPREVEIIGHVGGAVVDIGHRHDGGGDLRHLDRRRIGVGDGVEFDSLDYTSVARGDRRCERGAPDLGPPRAQAGRRG